MCYMWGDYGSHSLTSANCSSRSQCLVCLEYFGAFGSHSDGNDDFICDYCEYDFIADTEYKQMNGFDFEKPKSRPIAAPYSSTPASPVKNFGSGPAGSLDYAVGDKVRHIKFGVGTVTNIVSGGRDYEVTVSFESYGIKKMLASFANLKKC